MNLDSKIECVKRELRRRKKFYPGAIERGILKQKECDYEIAAMEEVLKTLTQLRGIVN
jgi:hypothetical protein